jgi:hypothetical protein
MLALASLGSAQQRMSWSDFSARMTPRHTLRIAFPDGAVIESRPLEIKPDQINVRITGTSDRRTHPKGPAIIPRAAISVVEVRPPRSLGKLIGTLAPIGVGAALVGASFGHGDDTYVRLVAGGLTMAAGGVGGFFIGRAIDRRFERIVIAGE